MKIFDKKNIENILALTPMQEGLLFHYLKDPGSDRYFEQLTLEISGAIDRDIFAAAWNAVIETNEMLRTAFRWDKIENPVQVILKEYTLDPLYVDYPGRVAPATQEGRTGLSASERQELVNALKIRDRNTKFDLHQVPFRVTLAKIAENQYLVIISNHHILYDGWSNRILLREFFNAYAALANGKKPGSIKKTKFKEFVAWVREQAEQDHERQKEYWQDYLRGIEAGTRLPVKKGRENGPGSFAGVEGASYHTVISSPMARLLEAFGKEYRITTASLFYSAWGILLHQYTGSDDVLFGTTVSGRSAKIKGIADMVGLFINTLPLRVQTFAGYKTLRLLRQTHESLQKREAFEHTPLVKIFGYSRPDPGDELFDSIMVIENYPLDPTLNQGSRKLNIASFSSFSMTNYDLTVAIFLGEEIEVRILYPGEAFENDTIEKMARHFITILEEITADPGKDIDEIDMLSPEEKRQLLVEFNDTGADYPQDKTIHRLFEEQVEQTPDYIALVGPKLQITKYKLQTNSKSQITNQKQSGALWADVDAFGGLTAPGDSSTLPVPPVRPVPPITLTYRELNERSHRWASRLKEKGVGVDSIVAIMVERPVDMIIGIFGILKAGGAYLPIDPEYPEERKQFMLADSGAAVLITGNYNFNCQLSIVNCQLSTRGQRGTSHHSSFIIPHSSRLAYIIYTSGSTGIPKGVAVDHCSAVNTLCCRRAGYRMSPSVTSLQLFSYGFDGFVTSFFTPVISGAKVILLAPGEVKDTRAVKTAVIFHRVTHFISVPSLFQALLEQLTDEECQWLKLEAVTLAGEKLLPPILELTKQKAGDIEIVNEYGVTEAAVMSTMFRHQEQHKKITIGGPVWNTRVFISSRWGKVLPVGVPGELCISGVGLARGYLNNPGLTAEKFCLNKSFLEVQKPFFQKRFLVTEGKIYKTGDLARWLPGGNIEHLGRIDFQVKIRGYRIEPGEIESQLLTHRSVKDALVMARQYRDGEKYLCAYVVMVSSSQSSSLPSAQWSDTLREYLAGRLPGYMIPAHFVWLEKMPLNPHGKIDTKALPAPGSEKSGAVYTAPGDEIERKLVEIWASVLGGNPLNIGIDDNFFRLGGHSLRATSVVQHIYKEFEVNIEIKSIFTHPTVRGLAKRIRELAGISYENMTPVEEKEYYPLSYAQRRLWVLCQFEADSTAYNIPAALTISGSFRPEVFSRAVQVLAERHESLRTVFISVDGVPMQKIIKDFKFNLEQSDFRALDEETKQEKTRELYLEDANQAFDLVHGPLFRFKVIRWEKGKYILFHNMHHIVDDGWSQGIISHEVVTLYNRFLSGRENPFSPLQFRYKDYSRWHNRLIEADGFKTSRAYWTGKFKDKPNGIELPLDHPRRAVQTFNGGRVSFSIDRERTAWLDNLSRQEDGTLFMSLLTLASIFLYRISGQADIIIGSPIANRRRIELHPIIGFFVNTLVYRLGLNPDRSFREQFRVTKEEALAGYQNQDYPFDLLVEQLQPERDLSRSPLFNVMLAHNNAETRNLNLAMKDLRVSGYAHSDEFNMSKFDLIFFMDEADHEVRTHFEYNSDLFERSTIEGMRDNFLALVEDVVTRGSGDGVSIASLQILSEAEREKVTRQFNDTDDSFGGERLAIQEMFQRQVEKSEDKIAVLGMGYHPGDRGPGADDSSRTTRGNLQLTYKELNREANRLAHFLREKYGVKANDVIGLSMERSVDMIVVLLGVIKAGAAYLAVDPAYPRDRVLHVLADSRAQLLITDGLRPSLYENYQGTIIDILSPWENIFREAVENPAVKNQPPDVLYVNYTSGSTGTPNGAMLSHDILRNLIQWQTGRTSIDCSLRCLQFTSINFCVSFQEIMGTLTAGGELILIGEVERQDIDYLMDFLSRHRIENLFLPFSYLNFLFNESSRWNRCFNHNLKHIVTAGEQLKITAGLKRFLESNPHLKLHNHYGSTEMHVVTSYTLDASTAGQIPIPPAGKPISNVKIYILDEYLNPVPVGVWGELFVSGISEVLGYINNRALTESKLVNHPVFSLGRHRLYRSGDMGRWLADGNIELRGRKDFLVKIRGFRIEPGEIESKILSIEGVRECVVAVKKDETGQEYLAAYVVVEGIDGPGIRQRLSGELPQYMLPKFVVLDSLPLMPNGKVDRERLPDPGVMPGQEYVAPADQVEEELVHIWSELLGIPRQSTGVESNFFQLGGHSLKATLMVARIHKVFNVKIPLLDIFTTPYIRGLAEKIRGMVKEGFTGIAPVEEKDYYELSSAQERLYILQQMDRGSTAYNMPAVWEAGGLVDIQRIKEVFEQLAARHESLRTSFGMFGGKPVQKVCGSIQSKVFGSPEPFFQKGFWPPEAIIKDFIRPFDLSQAPLLRVGILEISDSRHILMVDMHHIISDGMSIDILVREFNIFYRGEGEKLPRLKIRYKDFSQWQNPGKQRKFMQEQGAYWREQFEDGVPVLNLPIDYGRPAEQSFAGSTLSFELNKEETKALKQVALTGGTTLFMLLLSVYTVFLSKLSSQEDIVVGTPVAGRRHAELEPIMGMFVNTLALRNFPRGEYTFEYFWHEVKDRALAAFANQDYPYEELVKTVAVDRNASRNPLFDVMFVLQNLDIADLEIPGLSLRRYDNEEIMPIAKFDLTLTAMESGGTLLFTWEYCTKLFAKETIQRFGGYFKNLVSGVLANPQEKICRLEIMPGEERQQVLYGFNETKTEYPREKTIAELYAGQVERTPNHVALQGSMIDAFGVIQLSYGLLNDESDHLAGTLLEKGIQPETIVGIMLDRSIEMVIGILGILKAGGAYMPIDPEYPQERIDYMIKDSGAVVVLTAPTLKEALNRSYTSYKSYRSYMSPRNLAYIMYTSGSTGKPRGVMVTHGNVTRLVIKTRYVELNEETRILQTGALVFDASTFEIWGSLLNGGRLVLADKEVILNGRRLAAALKDHRINTLWLSAPLFNRLVQQDPGLFSFPGYLLVGGDVLSPGPIHRVREKSPYLKIINGYGPTENTTFSTTYPIEKTFDRNIPIGRPISNSTVYIMDKYNHLVPVGVAGELVVGGDGVARGYLNQPELTSERFINYKLQNTNYKQIPNPNVQNYKSKGNPSPMQVNKVPGKKIYSHSPFTIHLSPITTRHSPIYKTGDLGRWLADGNIEFLGRIDYQVKIRGFRVEPEEIEHRLSTHGSVKEAVVVVSDNEPGGGERSLYAYYVPEGGVGNGPGPAELRKYLSAAMPGYMVPSFIIALDKIPLNPNGKIDRKALPKPTAESGVPWSETGYEAPRSELEAALAAIWEEELDVKPLGIHDNFFDAGGHSLKALQVTAKIHKAFGVEVRIQELFQYPTIAEVAGLIRQRRITQFSAIPPLPLQPYYELSYSQKRLWYINQYNPGSGAFNMPVRTTLYENVEESIVREVLEKLMTRHESLRTSFKEIGKRPVQVIAPMRGPVGPGKPGQPGRPEDTRAAASLDLDFESIDLSGLPEVERQSRRNRLFMEETVHIFDLVVAPLFRVKLVKCRDREFDLIFNAHHIISDGWSMEILKQEFNRLYEGYKKGRTSDLEPLRIQYKDYAAWHNERLDDEEQVTRAREFWKDYLSGTLPVMDLPYDFAPGTGESQGKRSSAYDFAIEEGTARQLRSFAREQKSSLFMVLLAGFNMLLSHITGQEEILMAVPAAARQHEDLENIVGMFVNTLILRSRIKQDEPFIHLFQAVQANAFKVLEYQGYPLELIFAELKTKYPGISVFFNMVNTGISHRETLTDLNSYHTQEVQEAKFDIVCYLAEYKNGIQVSYHYSRERFLPETIEKACRLYKRILENIALDPGKITKEYGLTREKKNLLRARPTAS